MSYKTIATNLQADRPHQRDIARLHQLDRTEYDTPGSIRWCACSNCNTVRATYGRTQQTWQGLARTKHNPYPPTKRDGTSNE